MEHSYRRQRPRADAKFLFVGETKLWVRGVTYGTFADDGYPDPATVRSDFEQAIAAGINAVRVYTVPPRWLLDLAHESGVRVLVGLPWEQHVTFLDGRARRRSIERGVQAGVAACAGHPAVLGYAVGNEIPASIVRWYGPRRVERFLKSLHGVAKEADPEGLVTYVNFPSTEYLELPFLDFLAFNVYLEGPGAFAGYLARLHTLAGDRPLVIAELGLDSLRHGEQAQARAVETQLRSAFEAGCAGAFTFSWTDEWVRNGVEVHDWSFGLVDRDRRPKPALGAVRRVHAEALSPDDASLPSASVVVCTHNGAATLAECLQGLAELDYPNHETVVVDDGSTDASAAIAASSGVRLISTPQRGLSAARNAGVAVAKGEVVAFLDDDCRPDRDWLRYLVGTLRSSDHAGVGGPNVPPADEGAIARCVARAPGGPTHVLLSDTQAEHIAGCNMAFWRRELTALGGFDERFWQAGDDVDLCWRMLDAGHTLGFSPSALVWHRRRRSVRAYLRQQRSYGRAEALLERKWPERYNGYGHVTWRGRMYATAYRRRRQIHYGTWGTGLFQQASEPVPPSPVAAAVMPEWYLVLGALTALTVLAPWMPLLRVPPLAIPLMPLLLVLLSATLAARAAASAWGLASTAGLPRLQSPVEPALIAVLALLQPIARLYGRVREGLTPWRRNTGVRWGSLRTRVHSLWCEDGALPTRWLGLLETDLKSSGAAVVRGGSFDRWDLHVRVGAIGGARVQMAVEEHGYSKQQLRFRVSPYASRRGMWVAAAMLGLTALGALAASTSASFLFGSVALVIGIRAAADCAAASATVAQVLGRWGLAATGRPARQRPTTVQARRPALAPVFTVADTGTTSAKDVPLGAVLADTSPLTTAVPDSR